MGLPIICGRDANAAAQIMQRHASIGPGDRVLDTATLPWCLIKTARFTWLFNKFSLLCVMRFSKIMALTALVHFNNSL